MDEHFTPGVGTTLEEYARNGDICGAHHLARYLWLAEALAERGEILDIGCGAGYGSHLIATRFPDSRVLAVDYDPEGVSHARSSYEAPNLRFVEADAMTWSSQEMARQFNAIISFDSIEHMPHRELFLENVVEHLTPEGTLYLSTPCGAPANDLVPKWEAHRIEYGTASLYDFLSRYFGELVRPEDERYPARHVFDHLRRLGIDYLLRLNPVLCRRPLRIDNPYRGTC
jgi:2-polyprenyl-3-methyl-5-hydroxy-6-metoxy-1,4-benzoquinol methylase